ncbi:MAG: hypothetical protein IPM53_05190 [Anaerolineaceae bacterium]|nr:hypothetical protein [Anaerolineaceae bacterium]
MVKRMSIQFDPKNKSANLRILHRLISERFDLSELKTLCLGLDIDFENLSGTNKNDKIRELITYMIRREELATLLKALQAERPVQVWPTLGALPPNRRFLFIDGPGDVKGWFFQFGTMATVVLFLVVLCLAAVIVYLAIDLPTRGRVTIYVTGETGEAVANAKVLLFYQGAPLSQFTDSNGVAVFAVESDRGEARILVEHEDYKIYEQSVSLPQRQDLKLPLERKELGNRNVIVRVIDESTNDPIEGAKVVLIVAGDIFEDATDSNGISSFNLAFSGPTVEAELQVATAAYETSFKTVALQAERVQDVWLNPRTQGIVGVYELESTIIVGLIEKEAEAVQSKSQALIEEIFAPDAVKINAATSEQWNARSRYAETLALEDHFEITHANIDVQINGNEAVATNDSCGAFTDSSGQTFVYSGPKSDRWEFERDENGRWWITSLTFAIVPTAERFTYGFEEGTHSCWSVRVDNDVPQGNPPDYTAERAHEGNGALHFSFDLADIPSHRAQIKYENMPFAGTFSAYVYVPPDAPPDLIASFYAMEYAHDPWNYHGIDTGEGQIVELVPGDWTEVQWSGDVSGWAIPVHLLGLEIRQEGEANYNGYVLVDTIVINGR